MTAVRFSAQFPGVREVYLAGDFNGWDPTARRMKRQKKGEPTFVAVVDLEPGRYEYKYVADGEWVCSEGERVVNDQGTENSVIEVT
jgi:1,4-alpha-glucan branching enzyme